jgi:hypothetical protein
VCILSQKEKLARLEDAGLLGRRKKPRCPEVVSSRREKGRA